MLNKSVLFRSPPKPLVIVSCQNARRGPLLWLQEEDSSDDMYWLVLPYPGGVDGHNNSYSTNRANKHVKLHQHNNKQHKYGRGLRVELIPAHRDGVHVTQQANKRN